MPGEFLRALRRFLTRPGDDQLRVLGSDPKEVAPTVDAMLQGVLRPLFILGIEQRSGTNYLGKLLSTHPELTPFPGDVFELPVLQQTRDFYRVEYEVHHRFQEYWGRLPRGFVPAFVGAGLMRHLAMRCESANRPLLKDPSVRNLSLFDDFFPGAPLLILIRDGRDVVASKIRSWPDQPFARACREWAKGAAEIQRFREGQSDRPATAVLRYEDLVKDAQASLRPAMEVVGLDPEKYDWSEIEEMPVIGSSKLQSEGDVRWVPVDRPDGFQTGGGWQSWDVGKRRIFDQICGKGMEGLGYT